MGIPEGKSDQSAPESIAPLLAPLQALQDLLAIFNNQGVIIGGISDIQALATSHPNLDKARIQFWVEQFGDALDLPELW